MAKEILALGGKNLFEVFYLLIFRKNILETVTADQHQMDIS